jgi:2-oxoglutarate dehydrogenase E2 component (dihydrolipoamide succinyltransferase)
MPTQVIMPQLGESVVEGTITKWLKTSGDKVKEHEPLLEINTDKVDTEIPSPITGTLLEILVEEGTTVNAGELLAWIGEEGEEPLESQPAPAESVETSAEEAAPVESVEASAATAPPKAPTPGRDRDLGFISPVVAKIANEHNIDLYQVKGTGREGRITKKDIMAYIESGARPKAPEPGPVSTVQPPPVQIPKPEPGTVTPHTPVRRAIAEHMVRSKHTSPHVTTVMEADLSRVVAHRQAHKDAFASDGVKLTFTPYFVTAAVAALKAFPIVNSSWSEDGVILHRQINIGMATSMGEEGLIVPVIKKADELSLLGLSQVVNDLANRARERGLQPDEVQGGTFTITNHGVSGSLFATPIINQPQCAILGVGAIQKRVVVLSNENLGDTIGIRPMAYLTLTIDHRILDGAIADNFLGKIVHFLQDWS